MRCGKGLIPLGLVTRPARPRSCDRARLGGGLAMLTAANGHQEKAAPLVRPASKFLVTGGRCTPDRKLAAWTANGNVHHLVVIGEQFLGRIPSGGGQLKR